LIKKTKIPKIKKDYKQGATYKELEEKYKVSHNELAYLVKKEKWKRKSNKSKTHKGNKNAVGNKRWSSTKRKQKCFENWRI